MIELKDQMNQTIRLEKNPGRIVSLVPSQTELLYDLGLGERVAGITKFCIHPDEWFRSKTRVGGTKNIDHEKIAELKPDLIIGNKEENSVGDIEQLAQNYPLYMSDIFTVDDALAMITDIGILTEKTAEASAIVQQVKADFVSLPVMQGSVLYLIWADPYMGVGNNTFIGDLIKRTGLKNVLEDPSIRYVELSPEQIESLNADYIFLSSEPFPFKAQHAAALSNITKSKMVFTDGELFSWYGSRMLKMKAYFNELQFRLRDTV